MRRCFQALPPERQAEEIRQAGERVIFAAPGLFPPVPEALLEAGNRLGEKAVTVVLDCDDEVCRLGLGDFNAIKTLKNAGMSVKQSPGLRIGVLICDQKAWAFAPPVLCVEEGSGEDNWPNAVFLGPQIAKALAEAITPFQLSLFDPPLSAQIGTRELDELTMKRTENSLKERPPQQFDIARQVRVYQSYFQYVEVHLEGLAIQRQKVRLPKSLINFTGDETIEARLSTAFDLIDKDSDFSDLTIRRKLQKLLNNLAPQLGKPWGRVLLREKRAEFDQKIEDLKKEIKAHSEKVKNEIQKYLQDSISRLAKAFAVTVKKNPPEVLRCRVPGEITEEVAENWLKEEFAKVFPTPEKILKRMTLSVHFRDVTYETLNERNFQKRLKKEFPTIKWPFEEFDAAKAKEVREN